MNQELLAVWNGVITVVGAIVVFTVRSFATEQQRLNILLNRTREEIARDYATNQDVDKVTQHIDQRFDRLEERLLTVLTSVQSRNNNAS
jgi:Tfp pilus assembly protein PilN